VEEEHTPLTDLQEALKDAEHDLEMGRFQDCEDKANAIHDICQNGDASSPLRLLWHCFRCCGRSLGALHLAKEQRDMAAADDSKGLLMAKMLLSMAELHLSLDEEAAALDLATQARETFRSYDEPSFEGFCLLLMASATSNPSQAEEWCCEALEAFQEDGHAHGVGRSLLQLSTLAAATKALDLFKFCGDTRWQVYTLQRMALLHWNEGDPEKAIEKAEAAMSLLETSGRDLHREAQLAEVLCAAHLRLGSPEVALRAVRSCLSRARGQDDRSIEAHMTYAALRAGEALSGIEGAMKMAMKCKEIFQELGDRTMEAAVLRAECELFLQGGNNKEALNAAQEAVLKVKDAGEAKALTSAALTLCHVRLARGEPRAAREALEMVMEPLAVMGNVQSRRCLLELKVQNAQVLMEMQDYESAGQIMFQARKDCQSHGDYKGEGEALMMLSRVQLERNKNPEAMKAAQKASELFCRVQDRLSEADALLMVSQAARRCVLSTSLEQRFVFEFIPGVQAAKDALAIGQHLDEKLLMAYSHLALAHLQVLSKDLVVVAWQNASEASDIFSQMGVAEDLAWSLEVQGVAFYHMGNRTDAVEAFEKAKEAFLQVRGRNSDSHIRRCDAHLKQMTMESASPHKDKKLEDLQEDVKTKERSMLIPKEVETHAAHARRQRDREVKDLSLLHGQELIQAQLRQIVEDLGATEDIEMDEGLQSAGLNSRAAVQMRSELEQTFGDLRFPATLAFDYPSIRQMSEWLLQAQEKHGVIAG